MPKRALNPQRFRPLCETAAEAGRGENCVTLQPLRLYFERLHERLRVSSDRHNLLGASTRRLDNWAGIILAASLHSRLSGKPFSS
jgi:hypothetical protein